MKSYKAIQGSLLAAGVATLSEGLNLVLTPNAWVGVVLVVLGLGAIALREFRKE